MKKLASIYINSYRGLEPSVWLLSVVMLVNRMGTMVLPFMTLYLTEDKGISIGKAGIVLTVFGLGTVCGGFIGGKLTDKLNFYFIQLFALLGGGIMFIILGQMMNYTAICIATFMLSLINESFRPANAAAIAHYSKDQNTTRSFTLNRLAINLGWAVGGALGGFVASKSYHLLFWIDGLTNISAAILLWLLLAPSKNKDSKANKEALPIKHSAYKDKVFLVFIILNTLFACCFFQIFTTIPVYFKQDLFLNEEQIGIVMALNGLIIAVFEMVLIHNLEGRRELLTYINMGIVLVGMGFIALNILPGTFSLALIFITFITFGEIVGMPFMTTFWVKRTTAANRGQYAGLNTMSWAIAQIAGPGLGAQIAQRYGFNTLWWVLGVIFAIMVIGYRWLQLKIRKTAAVAAV